MNKHKIYAPLVLVMGVLMFLLNYCTKMYTCALVFTLLMLTVNAISRVFGFKKAFQTVSAYVVINMLLLSDYNYIIGGQVFEYLVPTSLLAVLLASMALIKTTSLMEGRVSGLKKIFLALMASAMIDGMVMFVYFVNYLSITKVSSIFLSELSFRCLYAFAVVATAKVILSIISKYRLQNFEFKFKS